MAIRIKTRTAYGRAKIIETVQTPLGFFALVVLVVEAILGIVASLSEQSTQTIAVYGMLALIASLVAIVSFMAYKRPEALTGRRPTIRRHSDAPPSMEQVKITSVICVSTAEYDHLGIEQDAEILSNTFKGITLHRKMDLNEFRKQLSTNTFEIVHFLGFVDSQTGDLRFADNETLSPEGFLKLLELCGAKLVFLATCDSLISRRSWRLLLTLWRLQALSNEKDGDLARLLLRFVVAWKSVVRSV